MPMTTQEIEQAEDRAEATRLAMEDIKEFRRTQPALYQAICDYAQAYKAGNTDKAFQEAGDIAGHVLALAKGLSYNG